MRKLTGIVASDKMNKTVVVVVSTIKKHKQYGKPYQVTTRFKAHDENNECKIGDTVVIQESRPMSREKRWKVVSREAVKQVEQ
ncbi:MAG: 30S ribosomal protein S17 [Patescibacteria group bacterium]